MLTNPQPVALRDLTDERVQQSIEAEALSGARDAIERYLRRKNRDSARQRSDD